jgi:uncharacterized membrane protein
VAILFRIVAFLIGFHAVVLIELSGVVWIRAWASRLVIVWLGLFFVSVGNLLPRTRPNLVVGIRTRRTLIDRQLWIRLHRLSGYVAVVVGLVIVVSGAFLRRPVAPVVIGAAGIAAVAALALQYRRYSNA